MSTDELRELARRWPCTDCIHKDMLAIADRIDAERDKVDVAHQRRVNTLLNRISRQAKGLTDVQRALSRANSAKRRLREESDRLKATIAEMGLTFIKLPLDSDGEVWRIGDELLDDGIPCEVVGIGPNMLYYYVDATDTVEWTQADGRRHWHRPTVEDVLYESLKHFGAVEERTPEVEEWLHEQARRLCLADGDAQ